MTYLLQSRIKSNRPRMQSQQGFTLVELLTVMLVLVAIASVTIETSSELVFQNRYEVTKDRYQKIKKAIIGDPNQVINGMPNIEGFVKDMGRLPDNIRELVQSGYCVTTGGVAPVNLVDRWRPSKCLPANGHEWIWSTTPCSDESSTTEAACVGGHRWSGQQTSSGLTYGWNGPYLNTNKNPDSNTAFADGWANGSENLNYGWNFSNPSDTNLTLNSLGKDSGSDIYDYPSNTTAINSGDWLITGLSLNINLSTPSLGGTCATPVFNDSVTCEIAGGHWDGTCSPTSTYTTRFQCEVINGETWTATNNCSGSPVTPNSKLACEELNSTWQAVVKGTKVNIKYRGVDITTGETTIDTISSSAISSTHDGLVNNVSYDFSSSNIPLGEIEMSVLDNGTSVLYSGICKSSTTTALADCSTVGGSYDSTNKLCINTTKVQCESNSGVLIYPEKQPIKLTLIPNATLPTINW